MKVYLVSVGWDYEGYCPLGVFSTIEKAKAFVTKDQEEGHGGDDWKIQEYEIDRTEKSKIDLGTVIAEIK